MKPFSRTVPHSRKRKGAPGVEQEDLSRKRMRARVLDVDTRRALGGPAQFSDSLQHPLGVQPLGNLYLAGPDTRSGHVRDEGLGVLGLLFDDLLLLFLQFVEPRGLCRLAGCSRVLYAFVDVDSVWKEVCLDRYFECFVFQGTWRATLAHHQFGRRVDVAEPRLQVKGLFSDTLYHAWHSAQVDPWRWASEDTIPIRTNLTLEEFIRDFEIPNRPVVIRGVVERWPAFHKWNRENLLREYGDLPFKTDLQVSLKLADYLKYCGEVKEEAPIYLFDNLFGDRNSSMLADYEVPVYFREDLFDLIPGEARPSFRWLLIGPARSGATFHKDPNHTSAWNALISGRKKWIMFHPDHPPAGVVPSLDGMDVSTPETLIQWFTDFYRQKHPSAPLEFVQQPGDLVFIPSGWWHSVINLDESIAVTQNFVSERNAKNVYRFLKNKPSKELFNIFVENLRAARSGLLSSIEDEVINEEMPPAPNMEWDALVASDDGESWTVKF